MSQKNYRFRIIETLLKEDNHIRGLAKELGTNQTTISRKIKELEKNNVVDFRLEGKNKVHFLKKTIEAQEFVYLTEHYKFLKILKNYPLLKNIFQKIIGNSKIKLAILFGSYTKGKANKKSDIDIYIETKNRNLKKEVELINTKLSVKIGKYDEHNFLIREIEKNHVIIKGVELYYEKNKFFD